MTSSELDTLDDDASWCIGDEKEGFLASNSVCGSEISVSDGETSYDDDDSEWTDDSESVGATLHDESTMPNMPDVISFLRGKAEKERGSTDSVDADDCVVRDREPCSKAHDDGVCAKNCSDDSTDTGLTMACSELEDAFHDADSFHHKKDEQHCPQENIHPSIFNALDDCDDEFNIPVLADSCDKLCIDEIMAKASSMMISNDDDFEDCNDILLSADEMVAKASTIMASSDEEFEDYGFIKRETLEKVLTNPVQLAASLTIMVHLSAKKDREAKLSKPPRRTSHTYEVMPLLDFDE